MLHSLGQSICFALKKHYKTFCSLLKWPMLTVYVGQYSLWSVWYLVQLSYWSIYSKRMLYKRQPIQLQVIILLCNIKLDLSSLVLFISHLVRTSKHNYLRPQHEVMKKRKNGNWTILNYPFKAVFTSHLFTKAKILFSYTIWPKQWVSLRE